MVLLDEVQSLLPGVHVHGFLDSPYFVDAWLGASSSILCTLLCYFAIYLAMGVAPKGLEVRVAAGFCLALWAYFPWSSAASCWERHAVFSKPVPSSQRVLLCAAEDIPALASNFSGFQSQTRDVLVNFNAWSVISKPCYAQQLACFQTPLLRSTLSQLLARDQPCPP